MRLKPWFFLFFFLFFSSTSTRYIRLFIFFRWLVLEISRDDSSVWQRGFPYVRVTFHVGNKGKQPRKLNCSFDSDSDSDAGAGAETWKRENYPENGNRVFYILTRFRVFLNELFARQTVFLIIKNNLIFHRILIRGKSSCASCWTTRAVHFAWVMRVMCCSFAKSFSRFLRKVILNKKWACYQVVY